jgi:dTMP kinase
MFIVIEGTDASGKATQTRMLATRLERLGRSTTTFSFPRYATPLGEAILRHLKREIIVAQPDYKLAKHEPAPEDAMIFQCMMVVDKYDAAPAIGDALKAGDVVSDRWWPSAFAYGAADGLSPEWLLRVHRYLPQPDLYVLIDVDLEETARRRPERRDRYERDREKQALVRRNYRDLWTLRKAGGRGRWSVVDGTGTIEEVHERIWNEVVAAGTERF